MLALYGWLNLILVLVYFGFRTSLRLNERWGNPIAARDLAWMGQFLLALALLSPLGMRLLPTEVLPHTSFSFQQILSDPGNRAKVSPRTETKAPTQESAIATPSSPDLTKPLLGLVLLFGGLVTLTSLFREKRKLKKMLLDSTTLHHLGKVRVAISEAVSVPFAAKLGRTRWVVLPFSMIATPVDFRLALQHEIQHHRQGDVPWAIAIEWLIALFWCNPVLRLWKRTVSELQEFSCDAALVGRRGIALREYGSCLVRVAEAALETSHRLVGTTGMAAGLKNPTYFKSFLRRRIDMLVKPLPAKPHKAFALALGTLLALFTLTLAYGSREPSAHGGTLEVDPEIQKIGDEALLRAINLHSAQAGFALVADPITGRVLSVSNLDRRLTGRTETYWSLSQLIRPASVLKALVFAAAMEKGVAKPDDVYYCENGNFTWDGRTYQDWKGFKKLTLREIIANSSNIGAIKMSQKLGLAQTEEALRQFGFGPGGTSEGFPGSVGGFFGLGDEASDSFRLASLTIGSSLASTPLEILAAFGAIANGGALMKPLATKQETAQTIRRVLSEDTAKAAREVLASVVTHGTAQRAKGSVYSMAGKTGTAQDPSFTFAKKGLGNVGSFAGFAPVDKPRVVIYVGIINPTKNDGAHGSEHAVPVFREIAEKTLKLWGVPPDKT